MLLCVLCRSCHAHPDPYYSRPSTAKLSRQPPHNSSHDRAARPQHGARPATVSESVHNTWLEDEYEREYEYADSADDMHTYVSQEPPSRSKERSARMHARVRQYARPVSQKSATYIDSPDEDEYEDYHHLSGQEHTRTRRNLVNHSPIEEVSMRNTDVTRGHARRADVRRSAKGSTCVKKMHARQAPQQRPLSPFDSNIEDNDREWENVLLEATGGIEVGQRAGQRKHGGGVAAFEGKGAGHGGGNAWGLSDE